MSDAKPGPIRTFFQFIWNAVNFTNHLVFNLIMLFILIGILAVISAGMSAKSFTPLRDKTALVLDLEGVLVEQRTVDSISTALAEAQGGGEREILLRDVLRIIKAAKKDPHITHLVLNTDGYNAAGMASTREIVAALKDFKTSKKPVYAFADNYEQKQYLLAAQADKIFLDPEGAFFPEGLGRYRLFYREALQDKLGLDVHLFRVGEYKSAAEPYILDAASEESKQADLFWMNDIWQRYLQQVGSARGIAPEAISAAINELPQRLAAVKGDLAQLAVNEKWVDGLKTAYEMEQYLVEQGVAFDDESGSFQQIDMIDYLGHVNSNQIAKPSADAVAVVVAQGEIVDGEQPQGMVGGVTTSALIRAAREDDEVKALVLRVDSPGGSVFASEQIRREVELTKAAGKPVVVSMANVAASGGYWISMNADRIYADESTITGSIGIFGLMIRAPRTLEKIGVHSDGVTTTPWAGAFDMTRPMDEPTKQVIQSVIERGYAQFIGKVAKARKQTTEAIDANARGRVWSGAQAKEKGLVDAFGGLQAAIDDAAARAKLGRNDYRVDYIEEPMSPFEQFISNLAGNSETQGLVRWASPALGLIQQTRMGQQIRADLQWLDRNGSKPVNAVAHCFCTF
ncbi:signal peptide peptidase SppA [Arenimonas sp. GDDSR-1]|uniref:signal peptide peptidase SppA n=1 Tax=Arenimonas sp. GDDSR-1 TaxID=2950125 RepID=UPI002613A0B2|nr:signal peptide peptidase SppA [Arenimonas sp. GDDSR-1]